MAQVKPNALYYNMLAYQPASLAALEKHFNVTILENPTADTTEILAKTEIIFAPLGYQIDKEKIDACPKLKVVASNTTGHPHIDVAYCKTKGINVACLKYAQEFLQTITPTAELTFGLIIALTRNMMPAHQAALEGKWNRRPYGAPKMLSRMSLGVVGLGRLGKKVASYGVAFGMKVRYFDPYVENTDFEKIEHLQKLAQQSDILTIHVPHEKETEQLINDATIQAMPKGSYLINTARGEIIDWNALQHALETNHLAGAALDVFEDEFNPNFANSFTDHPFLNYAQNHPNIILTPHIGGSTIDAWEATELETIEMTLHFLNKTQQASYG